MKEKLGAINYAIVEIEKIKSMPFNEVEQLDNTDDYPDGESIDDTSYVKKITIIDYADMEGNEGKTSNIIKKATVQILYKDNGETQNVELSTILTTDEY